MMAWALEMAVEIRQRKLLITRVINHFFVPIRGRNNRINTNIVYYQYVNDFLKVYKRYLIGHSKNIKMLSRRMKSEDGRRGGRARARPFF
jgi:hypothetical protein